MQQLHHVKQKNAKPENRMLSYVIRNLLQQSYLKSNRKN